MKAGTCIGRYELLSELGRGGFGVVWKARHVLLPDRLVALKLLPERLGASPAAQDRFLREARIVARLDHPGIATLYDAEVVEGRLCIAFKLIEGDTVARVASKESSVQTTVRVGKDAADALAHAHAHGVIHRDISPGNIMVDRDGHGVIVDFGLAHAFEQSETVSQGAVAGTLAYMAPEVIRGEAPDSRSDLYSLGAVMYRMLTGRPPFEGSRPEEITARVLRGRPVPPSKFRSTVPPELDHIVLRAMERHPGDRYSTALELASALERVDASRAQRGTAVPGVVRTAWKLRRLLNRKSWRLVTVGGLAALVTALGLGIAWTGGWRPPLLRPSHVVAVLPPRNLSENPDETGYLAEAFGEELTSRLGEVAGMRMVPWITTQRFNDPTAHLREVGRELDADRLVVGSFRSDGERVRVTVVLVDGRSGHQTWSHDYEEALDDLFMLQQSLALGVASRLSATLTNQERSRLGSATSSSLEAYEFYLRGADLMKSQDPSSVSLARPYFERALELDPNLAHAWVGLGAIGLDLYYRGLAAELDLNAAEKAFRRALTLDLDLYPAMRGVLRIAMERDHVEEQLRIASMAKGSEPEALLVRGWGSLICAPRKAMGSFNRVLELDPANQAAALSLVYASAFAGDHSRTLDYARSYIRRFGEDPEVYDWLGLSLFATGRLLDARLALTRALELSHDDSNGNTALRAMYLYRELGETARADSLGEHWLEVLDARAEAFGDNTRLQLNRAELAVILGREDGIQLVESIPLNHMLGDGVAVALAIPDLARVRDACVRVERASGGNGIPNMARSGDLRLRLGSRYQPILALPEYQELLKAVERRHGELVAKYLGSS